MRTLTIASVSYDDAVAMIFEERLRDRSKWSIGDDCSAERVLSLLSTKTVFLVIRECFYGTERFDDFVTRTGTSAPAVSRALRQLEKAEVIDRVPYREPGSRARDAYRLTQSGEELLPVFLSLMQWGDKYLQDGRPPLQFVEAASGKPAHVSVTVDAPGTLNSDNLEIRLIRAERRSRGCPVSR